MISAAADTQILGYNDSLAPSDCETDDGGNDDFDEIPILYGETQVIDYVDDLDLEIGQFDNGGGDTDCCRRVETIGNLVGGDGDVQARRKSFFEIRAEAFRSFGCAAAENIASKNIGCEFVNSPQVAQEGSKPRSNYKSTKKKLFSNALPAENEECTTKPLDSAANFVEIEEIHEPYLAGLSYVDSQEPGELSQEKALAVLDNFLNVHNVEFSQESKFENSDMVKLPSISRGALCLAEKIDNKRSIKRAGIFDWNDSLSGSGGDLLSKEKGLLFVDTCDTLKIQNYNLKSKHQRSHRKQGKVYNIKKKDVDKSPEKATNISYSDAINIKESSGGSETVQVCEVEPMDDPLKNMDEETNKKPLECHLQETDSGEGGECPYSVGPNTQMAAEAMEALCNGIFVTTNTKEGECRPPGTSLKCSSNAQCANKAQSAVFPLSTSSASEGTETRYKRRVTVRELTGSTDVPGGSSVAGLEENAHCTIASVKRKRSQIVYKRSARTNNPGTVCHFLGEVPTGFQDPTLLACQFKVTTKVAEGLRDQPPAFGKCKAIITEEKPKDCECFELLRTSLSNIYDNVKRRKRSCRTRIALESGIPSHSRTISVVSSIHSRLPQKTPFKFNLANSCTNLNHTKQIEDVEKLNFGAVNDEDVDRSLKAGIETLDPESYALSKDTNLTSPTCTAHGYSMPSSKRSSKSSFLGNCSRRETTEATLLKDMHKTKQKTTAFRILFSHHLDAEIVKLQKKILAQLGLRVASSMSNATHFVADKFARTQNMLEAIAKGKPVVTSKWLISSRQENCLVDERSYILRDFRKEKEIGFDMTISLSRACQCPLLQGKKVMITSSVKPNRNLIMSLVKAASGLVMERNVRYLTRQGELPDDLLVISCEEDYNFCIPVLEKGANVYSAELLLNGIVVQKLEYERHQIFLDYAK